MMRIAERIYQYPVPQMVGTPTNTKVENNKRNWGAYANRRENDCTQIICALFFVLPCSDLVVEVEGGGQ